MPDILSHSPQLEPDRLKCFNFEVKDLKSIREHFAILNNMIESGLFQITIDNLEYIYQNILGEKDIERFRKMNYTVIRSLDNTILIDRVERDFDFYFINILNSLEENSYEDATSICLAISHEMLDENNLREFLEKQTTLLPNLKDVPESLHKILFDLVKIEPTWANCVAFMNGERFESESLVGYLEHDEIRATILQQPIPKDTESKELRMFLFEAHSLSDKAYEEYIRALPTLLTNLPKEIDFSKLKILIKEKRIVFSKENFDALTDHKNLQISFVATNVHKYLEHQNDFALEDNFREELLRSNIDQVTKLEILKLMDLTALTNNPDRAALIGPIIDMHDKDLFKIDSLIAQSLIINSEQIKTQISLFNKFYRLMNNEEIRHVLKNLPKPFSEITTGYHTPKLKNNQENLDLVKWLESKNIISSWSESTFLSNDIKVNLYRNL